MAKSMTPSEMTAGQITKAVSIFRAMLEKHAPNFDVEAVQAVLGQPEFVSDCFANFRKRVEMISGMIVRKVSVNRNRTPQDALDATNRVQYTDRKVVDSMPKGEGDEVEVVFFKPRPEEYTQPGWMSDDDLEKALALRGLKPADPISVAAVNEADPTFADEKPHGTHWKDAQGNWCYAAFGRWDDERRVGVGRVDDGWSVGWWFAGVRK